jgi:hypothetical protein
MCASELGGWRYPKADLQQAVIRLRQAGMSQRQIAAATGVTHRTVGNTLGKTTQSQPATTSGKSGGHRYPTIRQPASPPVPPAPASPPTPSVFPEALRASINNAKRHLREAFQNNTHLSQAEADVLDDDLTLMRMTIVAIRDKHILGRSGVTVAAASPTVDWDAEMRELLKSSRGGE